MKKNGKVFIRISFGKYEETNYTELIKRCVIDESYRDKLFYPFSGILMEVTKEEYAELYKSDRRQKYLMEESELHGEVSYNALDTDEMNGEETVIDIETDVAVTAELVLLTEQLYKCLELLPEDEYRLIHALFYEGISEREWSKATSIPPMTIHDRKVRIVAKLKKLIEN